MNNRKVAKVPRFGSPNHAEEIAEIACYYAQWWRSNHEAIIWIHLTSVAEANLVRSASIFYRVKNIVARGRTHIIAT